MTRCLTVLTCLAMAFSPSLVRADVKDKVREMTPPTDSKDFTTKAAEGGMLEVKLAQLAQQKAQSSEVKQLAQHLEQDHTKANQELMAAAKQKNINLPTDLNGEAKEVYEAFQQLNGAAFDNAFVLFNIKDHLKDIGMFQNEARNGTDPDIKAWAAKTVPTLRQHTGMIRPVAVAIGIPIDALSGMGTAGSGQREGAQPAGSRQEPTGTTPGASGSGGSSLGGSSSGGSSTDRPRSDQGGNSGSTPGTSVPPSNQGNNPGNSGGTPGTTPPSNR